MEVAKEIKKTITSIFMVPTLKIPREALRENGFINGFVGDEMRGVKYTDAVYLLFKPDDLEKFREFLESEYERTKQIIDDYDYPNGFVVVVYKLNMRYKEDFSLVKKGKYSRTSQDFQNEFPMKVQITLNGITREDISLHYRIFNKTEELVKFWEEKFDVKFEPEYEVYHGFQEESEILTEEKLKEYL